MSGPARVELRGVSRSFRGRMAVRDVSFDLRPGEVLGLLGPNGAGKTTTMRMLTGFLRPTSGTVIVDGVDLWSDPVTIRSRMGYMPESSALYPEMTVESYLRFWAKLRRLPTKTRGAAVAKAMSRTGLREVGDHRIGTLSRGFRQRVSLAQAVLHDPPILVLDEPTAGLDPRQVADARDLIARLGRTRAVLLSSHLLSEVADLCRRVVVLDRGEVVAVDEVSALTAPTGPVRVEARVTHDVAAAVDALRALPGVQRVEVRGERVVVEGDAADLGEQVSTTIVAAGGGLLELVVTGRTSLEDAYLRLVSE